VSGTPPARRTGRPPAAAGGLEPQAQARRVAARRAARRAEAAAARKEARAATAADLSPEALAERAEARQAARIAARKAERAAARKAERIAARKAERIAARKAARRAQAATAADLSPEALAERAEARKAERIAARKAERIAARRAEAKARRRAAQFAQKRAARGGPASEPSTEPALVAQNLTVKFRPFSEHRPSLRRHGLAALRRYETPVVAVDDVSLTIYRGEALGVIGSNGAGKTTLLRVLAGTLPPDTGVIEVHGTEAPVLLSLGAGFNRHLSGRRNIYLGGLAAGLRREEIDAMFGDIVEYSGLGDAIDRPTSTYSSGMFARLAFAVAIRRKPQILLLDEVFAVGDQAFRQKSTGTMLQLLADAGTIVMVSHSLGRLRRFCHRLAWMDKGRLMAVGEPTEISAMYLDFLGISEEDDDEDEAG
jgi:ABC-type polysaccharide/polyol phosphate transport system ATPase subunit